MTYNEVIGTEDVKERFMGNFKMFSTYLYQFAEGKLYHELVEAVEAGAMEKAFEIAHDMKGVVLNLSLKPMEPTIRAVVESLRNGKFPEEKVWGDFLESYRITAEQIEKMKEENVVLF